jgi:hypothetical protein
MHSGKTGIQSGEAAFAPSGEFSQPGIRDLRAALQVAMGNVQKVQ